MNPVKWLAALPVIAFFSGGWLSAFAPKLVFGLPFLMVWNIKWLVLTSLILWVIDSAERDDADADVHAAGDGR